MTDQLPTPVMTVLATMRQHRVRTLLMGGQACIVYGASEFSRDVDLVVLAHPDNLVRLRSALRALGAEVIAVPPFDESLLARGHAVHFRCAAADGIRLDIMSVMRGVPDFETCWARRTVVELDDVEQVDVLGLEDLVFAKKTRRDKDWPVIRRLVDVHYRAHANEPTAARLAFWLRELRTVDALLDLVQRSTVEARASASTRAATACAIAAVAGALPEASLHESLRLEEQHEREADELWWHPLQQELEEMRRRARRGD